MKIAMVQMNSTVGDIRGNRDGVLRAMMKAEQMGADLAVFPELCLTGYPPRDLLGLSGFVGANLRALQELAARSGRMGVIVGFVDPNRETEGKELYNAAGFLFEGPVFPYGTLIINLLGSLIVGFFVIWTSERVLADPRWRLLVVVGFCGAFTTFSSYAFESMAYFEQGQWLLMATNILTNNLLCLAAALAGMVLARVL